MEQSAQFPIRRATPFNVDHSNSLSKVRFFRFRSTWDPLLNDDTRGIYGLSELWRTWWKIGARLCPPFFLRSIFRYFEILTEKCAAEKKEKKVVLFYLCNRFHIFIVVFSSEFERYVS